MECGSPRPAAPVGWVCSCGAKNTGKFCSNCGKPAPAGEWTCECGTKNSGAADKVTLPVADGAVIGQGATAVTVEVTGADGKTVTFTVNTDEETLGAALLKLGVVAGDDSEYGLYVKTVNGETADYDTDGSYWAFYIDGEYASTGVDSTEINEDAVYTLQVEKA